MFLLCFLVNSRIHSAQLNVGLTKPGLTLTGVKKIPFYRNTVKPVYDSQ
jgi:hypothetical protein